MRKRMMPWSREPRIELPIKAVNASRAMYIDEETQRVRITFTTTDDQQVTMELTMHQAIRLVEQTTQSLIAMNPMLKTSRGYPF